MISSEYKLFHSECAPSDTKLKKPEAPDALLPGNRVPDQATASDSLSQRTVEHKPTDNYMGSSGFSSVFFDARSQEYIYLVKAIRVMEKGPAFNDEKLGPISRKRMTISQLRKMKNELIDENCEKLLKLEHISDKISSDVSDVKKEIRQQDVTSLLEILSDFYSSNYFIKCMYFILHKVIRDNCHATNMVLADAIRHDCGEIIELIYRIVLSRGDIEVVSGFKQWYLIWDMYYVFNIVGCCHNSDGSFTCSSYFSPELPVKLALKSFGNLQNFVERKKEFLEMNIDRGNYDKLKIQDLHFNLLAGKDVNVEMVISHVENGCRRFQFMDLADMNNFTEYLGLLQFLHSTTVCVLERSVQDARRLLECYQCFSYIQPSSGVLKQYMQARCHEKSGAIYEAGIIYQSLVSGEYQIPVFEELIACLEKLGDSNAVVKACMSAADYYWDKGIKWREEYYEHKAAGNMLFMASVDDSRGVDQSTGQDEIEVCPVGPDAITDAEPQARAISSKNYKGKRKNKARREMGNHKPFGRHTGKTESAQSCSTDRSCSAGKVKKDTSHVLPSLVKTTDSSKPVNGKSERNYWRELNDLFLDYYHVPHRYRDDVENLSREACHLFPNDIWILHSAGWGFHLIGEEKKAAELLLKGLRQYLDNQYPEIKSFIPVNIDGNFEPGLDRLKAHPGITPGSSAGLNVAAYLSSLAYVYRNLNKHYDVQMRSYANWLNPSREARKNDKQRLPFTSKVSVIPADVDQMIRKLMAFGHGC